MSGVGGGEIMLILILMGLKDDDDWGPHNLGASLLNTSLISRPKIPT